MAGIAVLTGLVVLHHQHMYRFDGSAVMKVVELDGSYALAFWGFACLIPTDADVRKVPRLMGAAVTIMLGSTLATVTTLWPHALALSDVSSQPFNLAFLVCRAGLWMLTSFLVAIR